jgi:CspA family cold shock protein
VVVVQPADESIEGVVREWSDEDGFGILDSEQTPGGCWAHYSAINMDGYKRLRPGQRVRFTFTKRDQDGWPYAADVITPGSG